MFVLGFLCSAVLCTIVTKGSSFRANRRTETSPQLTTPQLASELGYEAEEHEVTTEDGYILTNFRLKRRNVSVPLGANVFLLFSGFIISSDIYFLMTEKPFVLNLVDDGYDVWLGNVKGTRYGKRHKILSPTDVEFWDFSNHEQGVYDIPAVIDYVLEKTRSRKLGYIGYSHGCTTFFIMMSERPEYNEKVAIMIALSPAVYFNHSPNILLRSAALFGPLVFEFAKSIRLLQFLSLEGSVADLLRRLCTDSEIFPILCRPVIWEVTGPTTNGQNDDSLRHVLKYTTSSAVKVGVHYGQIFGSGKFQRYKYLTHAENLRKYGSLEPPEYNVKNAKVPIVLFTATNDNLVNPKDVKDLMRKLPNVLYYDEYSYGYYGHYAVIGAINASQHIYDTIQPLCSQISFS